VVYPALTGIEMVMEVVMKNEITMLDQNEVAEMLKVSPKTLEYWRYKGCGPRYIKVGKKLARYLMDDINEFIMSGR
jgi:predicted DNA-binding transcriptional regulator AlpA